MEVCAALRGLPLAGIQKYPPPKIIGLPFGHERRVFLRYLRGESSQLDASALSSVYRSFASPQDKLLYRAFRQNEALSRAEWAELIGAGNIEKWLEHRLLREVEDERLRCRFSVVALDGLLYTVDPLNDHAGIHETVALNESFTPDETDQEVQPFYHTYIGQDSLRMIENLTRQSLPRGGRYLDCGPGAGALLLYLSRRFDEAIGIDINRRAASVAQFNAELNELKNCRAYEDDALNVGERYGRFDLVTWNLPFVFMPDDWKDKSLDGYGGEMGIELGLSFIETLPALLKENGVAHLVAMSPILQSGENVLEEGLKKRLPRLKLDCTLTVSQATWADTQELWSFHQSFGIRKSESVYLRLQHGAGELQRVEVPLTRKLLDVFREKLYQRKFA
jgi:2-polyprenyl-3-methyl-5-hydroxy-6-metoxy-1,4-benzoquinol methylase